MARQRNVATRQLTIWAFIGMILFLIFSVYSVQAAYQSGMVLQLASGYPGLISIDGPVDMTAKLDPPVAQVGDTTGLEISLFNRTNNPIAPRVEAVLPPTVELDTNRLPTGVTYNFQTRAVTWMPVLNSNGGTSNTKIFITIKAVDPDSPATSIRLVLAHQSFRQTSDLNLWAGTPPIGQATALPQRASIGQPIQLQAEAEGSGPFGQVWSLGDGRIVPAINPIVVYPEAGTYLIELQLSNPLMSHSSWTEITIVPEPSAYLSLSDTTPSVNDEVFFTSQSGGEGPLEYLWEFGDGTFSTDPNPTHRYPVAGQYTVLLTVRNGYGQAQNFVEVFVGDPPIADAIIDPVAAAGQPVLGTAFTDDSVEVVAWDMGDGNTYEGDSVEHTYMSRGSYIVSVDAINVFGKTTISRIIDVSDGLFSQFIPMVRQTFTGEGIDEDFSGYPGPENGQPVEEEVDLLTNTVEFREFDDELAIDLIIPDALINEPATVQLSYLINSARSQAGVNQVAELPELARASQAHTDDMASAQFTSHTGSDGSQPVERLARNGYRGGGYAGEATAWGFSDPRDVVDFWLNSPPHRAILLNPIATHLGVAQTINVNSPSIWYWTAEFGSSYGQIESQMLEAGIRPLLPPVGSSYAFTETMILNWHWPLPLNPGESFVVYSRFDSNNDPLGVVEASLSPERPFDYGISVSPMDFAQIQGTYGWFVQLEKAQNNVLTSSPIMAVNVVGGRPTPVPTPLPPALPTLAPTAQPVLPTAQPTATNAAVAPLPTAQTAPIVSPTPIPAESTEPTTAPTLAPLPSATAVPPTLAPLPTQETNPSPTVPPPTPTNVPLPTVETNTSDG